MDLEKYSVELNVSVRKLRAFVKALRRDGHLPPGDRLDDVKKIKMYMNHGQVLSVAQFVQLIEHPDMLKALGAKATAVRREIALLDNPKACDLPRLIAGYVRGASSGEAPAVEALVDWIKATMPAHSCTYHYFAVRIILGLPEQERGPVAKRLHRAFLAVCKHPDFAGWFHVVEVKGKRRTIYHRPK